MTPDTPETPDPQDRSQTPQQAAGPRRTPLSGSDPESPVFGLVHLLAWFTTLIGIAMVVLAFAGGGGIASYGVLVGALFAIAGGLRLRLLRSKR